MARKQAAGRNKKQKYIYIFLIFGPILLAAMHQALTIYLFPPDYLFFLLMQGENAQEPNSRVAFVRAALPHPGCFMVDSDPAKRSKATMTTPSSNK